MGFESTLRRALLRILRPLVAIALKYGVSASDLFQLVKQAYVEVAEQEFGLDGKPPSTSRIAILTGLHRTEVARLRQAGEDGTQQQSFNNRAAQVISAWQRDGRFCDESGQPRVLDLGKTDDGFTALVKHYSGGMPSRAMLDELLRVGAVERSDDNKIRLTNSVYVPADSAVDKLEYMGEAVADLLQTIRHNLDQPGRVGQLQLSVAYDNVPQKAAARFRKLGGKQAVKLLKYWDDWLAQHDRDINPAAEGEGQARVGLGIYFFEQDQEQDANGETKQ